ncbi:hypothetical protein CN359_31160 [Bacillus thuringiensis]|nr:hypothetical protein CN359_31160 [Bacillus thuringiensis]
MIVPLPVPAGPYRNRNLSILIISPVNKAPKHHKILSNWSGAYNTDVISSKAGVGCGVGVYGNWNVE